MSPPSAIHLASSRRLGSAGTQLQVVERCFLWVRDRVRHSFDDGGPGQTFTTTTTAGSVTCTASEVLEQRSGICFAKSHLLAALLRANGIPAGFGYQRLSIDDSGPPFALHGFNWVALPGFGWHPLDARGHCEGVATCFEPPAIVLAYTPHLPGEHTNSQVFTEPLPEVLAALRSAPDLAALRASLPDWRP